MTSRRAPFASVVHMIGASALASCGSSSSPTAFAGADGGADVSTHTRTHDAGSRDAATYDALHKLPGTPPSEASIGDQSAGCTHLNIGIFGNPGSNPSSDFQEWLIKAGTSAQRIQNMAPTPTISSATLQPFDVIILDQLTRDYATAEATAFASFVSNGGGVVSLSGYTGSTSIDWRANSLLAPLEVAYAGPLMSGPVTEFAIHPITQGLTSVTFEGGYAIADLGGTVSTRTPIGFLPNPVDSGADSGTVPVAYAIQMGSGRAFVWGDEWIEYDSEWSTLPEIEELWVQVFAWIAPVDKCKLAPPK